MKHRAKLLGLCLLAAFCLAAISATMAQAENEFLIGSPLKTFTEAGVSEKIYTAEVAKGYTLNETLSIFCPNGKETEIVGIVKKGGTATAKAVFKNCKVFGSETHCKIYSELTTPNDPATLAGKDMIMASGAAKLIKNTAEHYVLFEGLGANKILSTFDIAGDFLCPVGTNTEPFPVEITGSTALKLVDMLTVQTTHNFNTLNLATLQSKFPSDKLKLGENEAHLSAKSSKEVESAITGTVKLTSGELWGAN